MNQEQTSTRPGDLVDWFLGGDVGTSSKTIVAALTDHIRREDREDMTRFDIPHDPSDFERCYQLLLVMPQWRDRLSEVAKIFPEWTPMVREWGRMEQLFLEERPTGRAPKLYQLMRELQEEGYRFEKGEVIYEGDWRIDLEACTAVHGPTDLHARFEYDDPTGRWRGFLDQNWTAKGEGLPVRDFAKVLREADQVFKRVIDRHGPLPASPEASRASDVPTP